MTERRPRAKWSIGAGPGLAWVAVWVVSLLASVAGVADAPGADPTAGKRRLRLRTRSALP